jgi:hypothetical protein
MSLRIVCIFAIAACGGSGASTKSSPIDSPGSGSGSGQHDAKPVDVGNYDFGCGGNTACPLNQVCCSMPGATTTFGCLGSASCPAADQVNCDGPDECGGSSPVCCGVYAGDGTGQYPQCGVATLGTSCTSAAACPTHLESNCSDTTKVQICHVASDCTDQTNNKCCTFMSGQAQITFCIDATTAAFANATCHP